MNSVLPSRCFLAVEAENDPALAGRILHLLTVRGNVPEWFSVRKRHPQALRIAIELAGLDEPGAGLLAAKIRNLPTVLDVSRYWLHPRDQLKP